MEDKTPNEKQPLTLPFLITKGLVVYPNMNEAVDAGRPYSMEAIRQAKANSNSLLFVGCQKEADKDDIKIPDDVFETATLCRIVYSNEKDGSIKVRLIGSRRVLLSNIRFEKGSYIADGSILEDEEGDANEELQLIAKLSQSLTTSNFMNPNVVKNTLTSLQNGDSVGNVVDTIAQYLDFRVTDKVALLAERNTNERLKILLRLLDEQKQITQIEQKLDETVRERAEKSQKEYFLREKMKAIKDELGEGAGVNDVDAIKAKLEKNPYPENVKAKIKNELHRMEMMPDGSLESSLILNYIQT